MNSSDSFDQRVFAILDADEERLHNLSKQILELKRVKVTGEGAVTKFEFRPFEGSDSSGILSIEVEANFGFHMGSRNRISGTQKEQIESISFCAAVAEAHIAKTVEEQSFSLS